MITVRYARLEDAAGICRLHRSHVKSWTRKLGDKEYPVSYGLLSVDERWGYGGPWMSPETCAVRLNEMMIKRNMPFVAVKKGVIVGHMELFIGREDEKYGKNAHIAVLYVHGSHLREGVGTALLSKAIDVARMEKCDTLTTASAPENVVFYDKQGFTKRNDYIEVNLPVTEGRNTCDDKVFNPSRASYGCKMTIGRYQSSACHIFDASVKYALEGRTGNDRWFCQMHVNGFPSLFLFENGEQDTDAFIVHGWTKGALADDMVYAGLSLLSKKGAKSANMLLSSDDYEIIKGKYMATIKSVRTTLIHDFRDEAR